MNKRTIWLGFVLISMLVVPSGAATVAGVQAVRGPIHTVSCPSGVQVRFCLETMPAQAVQNPAGVTVSIGIFDEARLASRNAADPLLWCLYE